MTNPTSVRVAAVQYDQRRIGAPEEFFAQVAHFVRVAADYRADFVVFPEFLAMQTLSVHLPMLSPKAAISALTEHRARYIDTLRALALEYRINIVGGAHPFRRPDGSVQNVAHVFLRDGRLVEQAKIHVTPSERDTWDVSGGNSLNVIETDCGRIGVLVCYDSEFPELARKLVNDGAQILLVPFCTDDRNGYLRVRYCCQARAVENQVYVVMAGNVGNLPNVANMDSQYAQSVILTPCDFPFARDGIAAEATANTEMMIVADLSLTALAEARMRGTVRNLRDIRNDLYAVQWKGD
jgi:predicted amidohydrolase